MSNCGRNVRPKTNSEIANTRASPDNWGGLFLFLFFDKAKKTFAELQVWQFCYYYLCSVVVDAAAFERVADIAPAAEVEPVEMVIVGCAKEDEKSLLAAYLFGL